MIQLFCTKASVKAQRSACFSSAVLRGVTNWFINVLNATSVGRWDCTSAKWSEGESQVVACLLLPKRLLSAACAVKPQMVCCLLMLSGLVKNHFDRSHSQVNLCTLILFLLYEIQRKPPLSSEREKTMLLSFSFQASGSPDSMNYLSLIIVFM